MQVTLPELYETLASGNSFQMQFPTKVEAVIFQRKLGGCKFRQEKQLKALGMIEHLALHLEYNSESKIATFSLVQPSATRELKTYEILTIIPPTQSPTT